MQPYLFAHLPYYQLVAGTDLFVLFDDVQYIRRGWVNRNLIQEHGQSVRFTAPVLGAGRDADFRSVTFGNQDALVRRLEMAYSRSPNFSVVMPIVRDILGSPERSVVDMVEYSIRRMFGYLGLPAALTRSSALGIPADLRGQDRVLAICHKLGASTYVNATGGRALYEAAAFAEIGIELRFIEGDGVAHLSIVHDLMTELAPTVAARLTEVRLVS